MLLTFLKYVGLDFHFYLSLFLSLLQFCLDFAGFLILRQWGRNLPNSSWELDGVHHKTLYGWSNDLKQLH